MRNLQTSEIERMQQSVSESLNDLCTIHTPTFSQDSFGEQTAVYTVAPNIPCGYNPSNTTKTERGQIITLDCDAILRLNVNQTISADDLVTVEGVTYKVQGVTKGRTCQIVPLKAVSLNE